MLVCQLNPSGASISMSKGRHQNSSQEDNKNMLGNIGDLFVKCMRQVTKGHFYNLLGVSDYYVMYRQKAKSCFVKCLQRSPTG